MSDDKTSYRLVTRSDFDGLVCAILLKETGILGEIEFVHPKDVQDGKVEVTLSGLPPMRFAFDVSARGLKSVPGDDPWISSQPLGVHLGEVEVGRAGEEQLLTADGIESEFHLGKYGRVIEVQDLQFDRPLLRVLARVGSAATPPARKLPRGRHRHRRSQFRHAAFRRTAESYVDAANRNGPPGGPRWRRHQCFSQRHRGRG